MGVKILDAGGKLMLSGDLRNEVEAALNDYVRAGAKLITSAHQLGSSWVAACTLPPKARPDATQTMRLGDLADGIGTPQPDLAELEDGCKVEEFGFKRIITGPTKRAVEMRIEHLKQFGADLVGEIERLDHETWTAVVDTGGVDKTFRWN